MFSFLLACIDMLLQDYSPSVALVMLFGFGVYVLRNGIPLSRTILTEKETKTVERRCE